MTPVARMRPLDSQYAVPLRHLKGETAADDLRPGRNKVREDARIKRGGQTGEGCSHARPCGCPKVRSAFGVSCCVKCPLPACLFDVNLWHLGAKVRYIEMERLREGGATIREIAARVGRGQRAVFRGLARRRGTTCDEHS